MGSADIFFPAFNPSDFRYGLKGEGGAFFSRYKRCRLLTSPALKPDFRARKPIFAGDAREMIIGRGKDRLNDKNGRIARMGLRVSFPG